MFSWRTQPNLDPAFRAVYGLQFVAVGATVAGLFLEWWQSSEALTAFDLLGESAELLAARNVHVLGQPLVVLWMLLPGVLISGLRSFTGLLVTPVSYRRLALVVWSVAMLTLAHFYINFADALPLHSALRNGTIESGFWLTGSSMLLLGLLIMSEWLIRPPLPDPFSAAPSVTAPVMDAERLWRGDYRSCPYCGMLNDPHAKSCYNCHNLLFDYRGGQEE